MNSASERYDLGYAAASTRLDTIALNTRPTLDLNAQSTHNKPQPGDVRVNPKDGLRYAWIPPGKFRMGCSEGDSECFDNEKPARDVTLTKGFWMGQTEVTVEAYKKFASAQGSGMPEEAELNTGWTNGSNANCEWAGGRLPSEAEAEYAARAGSTGSHYVPVDEPGWYDKNSEKRFHPVGLRAPNAFALYDMYGENYYQSGERRNPQGSPYGEVY